jgi:transposase
MSMSRRAQERQESLWVPTTELPATPGNPFYTKLNELLREAEFDRQVEALCEPFYASGKGRPSIAPGVYFRMLLIGYFEGIDSERGIAWRCADSLSLKQFLGYRLEEKTPDHSSLSRIRTRLDLETHQAAFDLVLGIVADKGLLSGKALGVDSSTMEANAALRSIVRRDNGKGYEEFLTDIAAESGIPTPTRDDLAKIDKKRAKKGSNADWESPVDPEARITRMKDGSTHLAHIVEHAVDMKTGAIAGATIQDAVAGDTNTIYDTLTRALGALVQVLTVQGSQGGISAEAGKEIVADKGYHSNDTMETMVDVGCRSYISEPDRGNRNWTDKEGARDATRANKARLDRTKGKALMRKRGELIERSFAHTLESGAMRRAHLRGQSNIMKRYHLQAAAFNLGLVMRTIVGAGTPKGLAARAQAASAALMRSVETDSARFIALVRQFDWTCRFRWHVLARNLAGRKGRASAEIAAFSTGC